MTRTTLETITNPVRYFVQISGMLECDMEMLNSVRDSGEANQLASYRCASDGASGTISSWVGGTMGQVPWAASAPAHPALQDGDRDRGSEASAPDLRIRHDSRRRR